MLLQLSNTKAFMSRVNDYYTVTFSHVNSCKTYQLNLSLNRGISKVTHKLSACIYWIRWIECKLILQLNKQTTEKENLLKFLDKSNKAERQIMCLLVYFVLCHFLKEVQRRPAYGQWMKINQWLNPLQFIEWKN